MQVNIRFSNYHAIQRRHDQDNTDKGAKRNGKSWYNVKLVQPTLSS